MLRSLCDANDRRREYFDRVGTGDAKSVETRLVPSYWSQFGFSMPDSRGVHCTGASRFSDKFGEFTVLRYKNFNVRRWAIPEIFLCGLMALLSPRPVKT